MVDVSVVARHSVMPSATGELSESEQLRFELGVDRHLAHRVLFPHRHPNVDPAFKQAMIDDWHSTDQYVCEISFRGSTKSTTGEEAIAIQALYDEFRYCVIFGASFDLAAERLHAIRREFERNPQILTLWGDVLVQASDDTLELAGGVIIKAKGRGEALRGTKGDEERPDLAFFDDIEDRQSLATFRGRERIYDWLFGDAIPAMTDPFRRRIRIAANALHEDCLALRLKRSPSSGFKVRVTPIEYKDETGKRQSSWPDRFSLKWIDEERRRFIAAGKGALYEAEYMCSPTSPDSRPFKADMLRLIPRVKTWQAVYAMFDPARTTGVDSATTGYAAWSWIADKLVIWDAWGERLMPNEIVDRLFQVNQRWAPIFIGFEEDGLNQWALQPIRLEMIKRAESLPIRAVRAPKGKLDFIRGLQPVFTAGLVELAQELPELRTQLLNFPTGDIDIPNALAYAYRLRPGAPIYDDFRGERHVAEGIHVQQSRPVWVCLNATRNLLTAVVAQVFDGQVRIFGDLAREGDPAELLSDALVDLQVEFGRGFRLVAGPLHFDRYNNVGLQQACLRIPRDLQASLPADRGRPVIRSLLRQDKQGFPMLMVSDQATWAMRAFSGGYSRALLKQGVLADYAEDNAYRVLMEGLESFIALMDLGSTEAADHGMNAETADGRPYRSMLGGKPAPVATKGDWAGLLRGA